MWKKDPLISLPSLPSINQMIIHVFVDKICAIGQSMEVKLPRKGLKLDPRVSYPPHARFSIRYHDDGITVTLTRLFDAGIDYYDNDDDEDEFFMRLFDPQIETVPDFISTIYVYMGLDDEYAPKDTTLVIIHPSVKTIQWGAFHSCVKLRRVIMNENVETIEQNAFMNCRSLDAVFLPFSIKEIGNWVFSGCTNLRILSIPQTIDISNIGQGIIYDCHTFFRITQISNQNYDQVNQALLDFNRNLPPLHKVCLNKNVSAQSIRQCIDTHGIAAAYNNDYGLDRLTPMHILALNPHADTGAILTLLHANMGVVFETYSEGYNDEDDEDDDEDDEDDDEDEQDEQHSAIGGKTLLDCLAEHDLDSYLSIIAALCRHREAFVYSSPTVLEEPTRNIDADDEDHALKRQKLN